MGEETAISFHNLKRFIDSQLKILRTPLIPNEKLLQYINDESDNESTDIDDLSDIENESDLEYNPSINRKKLKKAKKKKIKINEEQLRKFLKQIHLALLKKYNSYYSHQPIYQVINQVLNNEARLNNTRQLNLITLNDYMTVFNESENKTLPTLQGTTSNQVFNSKKSHKQQHDENHEIYNIFMNGRLPNIKKEHILQLINELPRSNQLTSNNLNLITDYGAVTKQLEQNRLNLIKEQQRLKVYKNLKDTLKKRIVDIQKNLIVSTNNELLDEISSTRILIPLILNNLDSNESQGGRKLDELKKKMNEKLEQLI